MGIKTLTDHRTIPLMERCFQLTNNDSLYIHFSPPFLGPEFSIDPRTEMYAGRDTLVSHVECAASPIDFRKRRDRVTDGRTDRHHAVTLRLPVDAAGVIIYMSRMNVDCTWCRCMFYILIRYKQYIPNYR